MKSNVNKHGLSRHIPSTVAMEVRQRCGFGCVVCGEALVQYDHHDPEFADATKHRAEGIALLCPSHHTAKGNGMLSMNAYRQAIEGPRAVRDGGATTAWEESEFAPQIVLGNITYQGGTSVLALEDEVVLGFSEPEQPGGPPRLDLTFFDRDCNQVFRIEKNIITANPGAFDVKQVGHHFTVRSAKNKIDLEVSFYPPVRIVIERMRWQKGQWGLEIDDAETKLLYGEADASPIQIRGGHVLVTGPVLFNCGPGGSVSSNDNTIEWLGPRTRPHDSLAREVAAGGLVFPFPVWLLINEAVPKPPVKFTIGSIEGTDILPIFTTPELAGRGGVPEGFKPRSLGHRGLLKLLREVAPQQGFAFVALDPLVGTGEVERIPIPLDSFVETVEAANDEDAIRMLKPDA